MYSIPQTFSCQANFFGIGEETFTTLNVQHGKRFIVMSERTLLAQMLWDLKDAGDGLSYKKMASRSGGLIAASTLHSVMSGKARELTPDTITGLSKILKVSEARILAALQDRRLDEAESNNEERARLWAMYEDIPRQCQQDVLDLLEVLQRNHSLSARREKRSDRRFVAHGQTALQPVPDGESVPPPFNASGQTTKRMLGRRYSSSTHPQEEQEKRKQR
jgi:transcriptional regulator with XRE-family HTH domain